jgi:multidrug resistance protein, MATE family
MADQRQLGLNAAVNQAALAVAFLIIPIGALFQVVDGIQCTAIGALRGLKDTRLPMLMCFIGYCGVGLVSSLLLTFPLGLGPQGVWFGLFIGLSAAGGLLTWRFQVQSRNLITMAGVAPARAG